MPTTISGNLSTPLPPLPNIFFGRDEEKAAVVEALTHPGGCSARIAILGAPGIGKTSVAVAALHDPSVRTNYGGQRFFVQCDSAMANGSLLSSIAATLDISEPVLARLRSKVMAALSISPTILVLDNLESLWESPSSRVVTEDLLANLASIKPLSLIVTMRGAERPTGIQWTRPILAPLDPLSHDSARQAFLAIADVPQEDPSLNVLMNAVDGLPLAITLMANMAQCVRPDSLVAMWRDVRTSMLQRGAAARLTSVDVSLALSVSSPRLRTVPQATALLSLLALLPDGADIAELAAMAPSIENVPQCVSSLLRTALAYRMATGRIRVLAPIRSFMLQNHPPSERIMTDIHGYFISVTERLYAIHNSSEANQVKTTLRAEGGNIITGLLYCLDREMDLRQTVCSLTDTAMMSARYHHQTVDALHQALAKCEARRSPAMQSRCLRTIAAISCKEVYDDEGLGMIERALNLAREAGDRVEELKCRCRIAFHSATANDSTDASDRLYAHQTAELACELGVIDDQADALRYLALLEIADGLVLEGCNHLRQAEQLYLSASPPNLVRLLTVASQLAHISANRGDLETAVKMLARAVNIATALEQPRVLFAQKAWLGHYYFLLGDIPEAIWQLKTANPANLFSDETVREHVHILARAYLAMDRREEAVNLIETTHGESETSPARAYTNMMYADLELYDCNPDVARLHYSLAYESWCHIPRLQSTVADLLFDIAETWRAQGEWAMAREQYTVSAILNHSLKECLTLLCTLGNMADTYLAEGDLETAFSLTMAVLPRITWSGMKRRAGDCHFRLAQIAIAHGEKREAGSLVGQAEEFFVKAYDKRGAQKCRELRSLYEL